MTSIVTAVLIAALAAGFIGYLNHFAVTPIQPPSGEVSELPTQKSEPPTELPTQGLSKTDTLSPKQETIVIIRPGESLGHIASTLETSDVITNRYLFIIFARYRGSNKKIQAGEYAFSGKDTPEKILDMLVKGKVKLHRLTIPEGLNLRETAALVEKSGFGTVENFMKLATDRIFIESIGIKADSLEGYLFPETYLFPADTSSKKIIKSMVERFNKIFIPEWRNICKQSGFTVHQIVILASIIEKETGDADEMPLISSVFHNRLKRGMRLESDPTVIYGIKDFNGNITKKDLLSITPYNTYAIDGLPEGPIANPGKLSLKAALFPDKSEYIFFVSKKDTTHKFSKTLQEHNQAVRKYQLNR
ncbi:MAG: endolytic transglycosylase MltG [Desulfamplus sp.]|nr:endolytic transglycosylase MltG [Desulfamplus sp.]